MKTRNGFVSNSSTSSFVVLGILLDREENPRGEIIERYVPIGILDEAVRKSKYVSANSWAEAADEEDRDEIFHDLLNQVGSLAIHDDEEDGAPAGKTIVGITVADGSDNDFESIGSTKLSDMIARLKEIGLPTDDLHLIAGIRMC